MLADGLLWRTGTLGGNIRPHRNFRPWGQIYPVRRFFAKSRRQKLAEGSLWCTGTLGGNIRPSPELPVWWPDISGAGPDISGT